LFVAADAEADRFAERADSRMRGVVLSAAPPLGGDGLVVEVAPDLLEAPIASAAAPIAPTRAEHPTCAFTIDVEDWYQSSVDYDAAITDRVVRNVDRVCELLDACGVRGTFFIQGMVAEAFPQMIRDLLAQGHEIQSHGYSHRPLYKMDRAALRTELERARKSVEDAGGVRINSFRAPDFSILPENLWALESLAENGFEIDSSIFPMKTRRYGVPGWGLEPRIVPLANGAEIFEVPVAMARMGPVVLPVAGGGYFRLLPRVILETACRSILGEGRPVIIYCHPYEFNPREMDDYRGHVPDLYRIHQSIGRNSFVGRLRALFSGLPFGRLDQVLAGWRARA
jgi:polysaccharide deacetylase family protein (PEP-CTERM system associated)